MQPNQQRDGDQGLPDVEGAPDVNCAGEGTGLEEGSPLQKERAWRQLSQAAAPACCCCLPLLPACTLLPSWRFIYLFCLWGGVVEADGFQHAPHLQEEWRSPCFRGMSPQPPLGHSSRAPPRPPGTNQAWPDRFSTGPLQFFTLLSMTTGCPPIQRTLSLPAPPSLPSRTPLLTEGGGRGLSSKQCRGPSPKARLGGPQGSLGRASLSGPFGSWPQEGPPISDRRHLGGGRGRGLRAPGKGAKKKISPPRWPGSGSRGSGELGGPEATGDPSRGNTSPVQATEPKSEGWGGRRDPLSPRPAFPGLHWVRDSLCPFQIVRSEPLRGLSCPCLALPFPSWHY